MFSKIVFFNKELKFLNPLSANPTEWSNTLKQFVDDLPTNCLSVFDHFVKLVLKGLSRDGVVFILICNFIFFLYYLPHIKFLNTIVILFTFIILSEKNFKYLTLPPTDDKKNNGMKSSPKMILCHPCQPMNRSSRPEVCVKKMFLEIL